MRVLMSIIALLGCIAAGAACAQTFPSKPVKVLVPFAAGGPLDLVARAVSEKLSASMRQPFVMENRTGAGGNLGTEAAARAAPDGYTLLMTLSTALTANPSLYKKLAFQPLVDFRPLSVMATSSQMMVVHPSVPVTTLAEFVTLARSQPVTYAHAGPGSGGHLAMEYFKTVAGFETVQVPYRGNAPLVIDLVAGQVKAGFVATTGVVQHVRDGKLKGLAISSERRSPLVPAVPTMAEAGYPDFKIDSYFVALAPAGTPDAIVAQLESELQRAAQAPDLQDRFREQDLVAVGSSAAQARARLEADTALWARIAKAAQMQVD
ncbi:MAG: tripartite tricarboxylate transporter substrate binding protein [Hyphomicrobiales bacterium]|nr:tripartite tricarboxylate transporter substrate binding protein [Hyphomicrobiales bacterium]